MCPKDGEVFGIRGTTNGRSCMSHEWCGFHLKPNDLIRFSWALVTGEDGVSEDSIKAVKIQDGTETCTIGFLPRNYIKFKGKELHAKFAQIIELYDDSDNSMMRRKSQLNVGVASYRLLDDIQQNV